jgi:ABC-type transport system substrate-binding protein/class 3 adenylate cyclase
MPDWPAMTAPSSVTFADLLRHHRAAAGLTQEELAARAGLSADAISTLERGARRRPRKDTVALLAAALALPEEERAALATAARRSSAAALAATPPGAAAADLDDQNGHAPISAPSPDATLPHGSVTFLIAEIEDSTRLLQELGGDRYADVLAEVQALLGTVWAAHAGHELGTQGDRFFAVFAYADDALSAAAAAQQALAAHEWPNPWPAGAQVRLRMGVHSGTALLTAGRYVGLEVHRAARIAAAGHGGQIVVSGAVADQVAKFGYALPAGTGLRDLGKHRLQDLPHREELYQLVLPDLPGLPATYPLLRTLDVWPGLRADLTVVVGMSAALLAVLGILLALLVPAFPWAIGLGAAALALLLLLATVLARPVRRALETQWRDARKPVTAVTSALLSLVVVVTTLFITKPPIVIGPTHLGYDFSYTYHTPTHRGGTVTVEFGGALQGLTPYGSMGTDQIFTGLWQSCLTQLPDVALGLAAYKPDQCTEVPTVANGGEDPDGKWTIFHIDPRAVWSDGVPITAADYLFSDQLGQDRNVGGGGPPFTQHTLSMPDPSDPRTVRIDWTAPSGFGDYLAVLIRLQPVPLHVYATGQFAEVYDPKTGAYNPALAQQLVASPRYLTPPVDDGPFTVQSFVPNNRAVLVRNPRFFSNFFHAPAALDGVTLVTVNPQGGQPRGLLLSQIDGTLIADYRRGGVDLVDGLDSNYLSRLGGIAKAEVVTSPNLVWLELGFNQRAVAPNAQANSGVSIFRDKNVRKAFIEAFNRCAAVRAQLGAVNCSDPNLFTDEATTWPAPDYDPSVKLPSYNPADAAHLMDQAGYRVVDGLRRARDGKTPLHLTIATSFAGADAPLLARRLQQEYSRNLKVAVTLDLSGQLFRSGDATKGTFDIGLWGETGAPDPVFNGWDTFLDWTDAADAQSADGNNPIGIIDPAVIQRVQLASRTPDPAQSDNVYRELQRYVAQQFYVEPVFTVANVELVKPTLCNFKPFPQFLGDLWSMPDWFIAPSCP